MRAPNGARGERSSDGEGRRAGAVWLSRVGGKNAGVGRRSRWRSARRRARPGRAGSVGRDKRHRLSDGAAERALIVSNDCRGRAARARPCRRHGRRSRAVSPKTAFRSADDRRRHRSRQSRAPPSPAGRRWRTSWTTSESATTKAVKASVIPGAERSPGAPPARFAMISAVASVPLEHSRDHDHWYAERIGARGAIAGPAARAPKQSFIESDLCASRPVA